MSRFEKLYLKDIADTQTGPFGTQLHEKDYVSVGTPIVTVEHLGEIGFNKQNLPLVSEDDVSRLSKYTLKEGDIVFSRVGSVDRCTYVSKHENGWMFSGRCLRVRFNDKANAKYVSFYFRQKFFKEMMLNISVGATMPSLNTSLMANIHLYLPNKITQQKIASVLSALDSKIELNNRINAELEAMAKTLYDYWFVQFDFPDENGKPYKTSGGTMVWNEELKREIPEGWEVKKIKDFAITSSGSTPLKSKKEYYHNGNIPWINSGEVNNPFIIEAKKYITQLGLNCSSTKLHKKGTLLIAMYGATAGKVSILDIEACTNQAICAINFNNNNYRNYLKFVLDDLYEYLINLSTGSARDNLSQDKIKELQVLIPKVVLIEKFEKLIEPSFNKILIANRENQKLTELRDWLLPMLMNGQVRVE